ncbi:MAG: NAD(P)/FAD-dependent oxidoreductase [Methanomassiliicoccus sp.]|nr:NAD(P)/FAD-dependent oxidoreductase [Methanomassiliicoccus sp.]
MDDRDVVVVGSGPAGVSAGFFLRSGNEDLDVLMVDRLDGDKFARYHRMCGEAVSRTAFKYLSPLRPTNIVHNISNVREEWPGGDVIEGRAIGYILDRPAFLRGVVQRYLDMGGKVVRDAVEKIESTVKGTVLTMTSGAMVRAKHVIAADGANSMIRKALFREEPPIMMWTEQHIVKRKVRDDTITFIQAERYKGGYRWEFPAGDHARIGFPRGTDSMEGEEVLETHRRAIPMGGLNNIVRDNVYLTGDAAAMANPLTAGGIRVAMLSGRRAAEAVLADRPMSYQEWWVSSPFASGKFMRAFAKFKVMTDGDYARAAKGFGANPLKLGWCYLTRPEFRVIYGAYYPSAFYGW